MNVAKVTHLENLKLIAVSDVEKDVSLSDLGIDDLARITKAISRAVQLENNHQLILFRDASALYFGIYNWNLNCDQTSTEVAAKAAVEITNKLGLGGEPATLHAEEIEKIQKSLHVKVGGTPVALALVGPGAELAGKCPEQKIRLPSSSERQKYEIELLAVNAERFTLAARPSGGVKSVVVRPGKFPVELLEQHLLRLFSATKLCIHAVKDEQGSLTVSPQDLIDALNEAACRPMDGGEPN